MIVIVQHIDKVKLLSQCWDIIAHPSPLVIRTDGSCEQFSLSMECSSKLLNKNCEVFLVMFRVRALSVSWVLPVKVKTIKVKGLGKSHTAINKYFPLSRVSSHMRPHL